MNMRTWKVTIRKDGELETIWVKAKAKHDVPYVVAEQMGEYVDYVICD